MGNLCAWLKYRYAYFKIGIKSGPIITWKLIILQACFSIGMMLGDRLSDVWGQLEEGEMDTEGGRAGLQSGHGLCAVWRMVQCSPGRPCSDLYLLLPGTWWGNGSCPCAWVKSQLFSEAFDLSVALSLTFTFSFCSPGSFFQVSGFCMKSCLSVWSFIKSFKYSIYALMKLGKALTRELLV